MAADKRKPDIPEEVIESLARTLFPAIRAYFDSEEGQREFATWKTEKEKEKVDIVHLVNPK